MGRIRRATRLERNGFMNNYSEKAAEGQGSANQGAGYLIRNGRTQEECYLKCILKDRNRDIVLEEGFDWKKKRTRKRRPEKKPEELSEIFRANAKKSQYVKSSLIRRIHIEEAQELIDGWNVLKLARAVVIQG